MKKLFLIFFSIIIITTFFAFDDVFASTIVQTTECGDVECILDSEGVLTVTGSGEMWDYGGKASWDTYPNWVVDITSVIIKDGITSIGDYTFYQCTKLTNIIIPDSVTNIGNGAFYGCENLTNITIPESITSIGEYAFFKCAKLNDIVISGNVRNIGNEAFYGCESLTSITIPKSVDYIGISAFSHCSNLIAYVNNKEEYMGSFDGCLGVHYNITEASDISFNLHHLENLLSISVPNSITRIYGHPLVYNNLERVYVPFVGDSRTANGSSTAVFGNWFGTSTRGGVEYIEINQNYSSTGYYQKCFIPTSLKEVYITDATQIPFDAFSGCISIDYIELNEGVTSISQNAFADCDFLSVKIPKSVEHIGTDAFAGTDIIKLFVYEDSYAHKYAKENNYPYELIGSSNSNEQNYETENENKEEIKEIIRDISVNGVTLDYDELEMKIGETAKLDIDISPNNATNKDVIWSTSKSSVATVKNGKVAAVGVGTAKITVKTQDGGYKATCIVTVEDVEDTKNNQIVLKIGSKKAMVFGKTKSNDVAPKIVNGRTVLPARFVTENLGAVVDWNSDAPNMVLITKDDINVIIYIGSDYAYVNGKKEILDSPAFIENGRTYTPVRFICESLGADVNWKQETQEVIIIKK